MARPSDIEDPVFRAALEEAERLIDEGDYTKASRRCAETYLLLLDRRPDLVPPPGVGFGAGFGPGRAMRRGFWPGQGGIRVIFDEDRKPSLSYEKDRFSLTEALTYFEFMVEQVVNAQREPP